MRPRRVPKVERRGEAVILFSVGTNVLAVAASAVEEIREPYGLKAFRSNMGSSKVNYTLERNGKKYFVVDSNFYLRLLPSKVSRVLVLRDIPVAITADSIDRMTEIPAVWAVPSIFQGEERRWYRGLAVINGNVVPVIEPKAILSADELVRLASKPVGARA